MTERHAHSTTLSAWTIDGSATAEIIVPNDQQSACIIKSTRGAAPNADTTRALLRGARTLTTTPHAISFKTPCGRWVVSGS